MMTASVGRHGGLARRAAVFLALLLPVTGANAANGVDDFRILYAESFPAATASSVTPGTSLKTEDPLLGGLSFDAYGKRFNLVLERNTRVMQYAGSDGTAYLGTLAQLPGSWLRLTRTGSDFHGLIWDGSELYVVEPTGEAQAFMVTPPATAGGHVIYRLSDTLVDLGPGYCSALDDASSDPAATGLTTFKSMATELKSQLVLQQAAGATRSLNLSALGDASFLARYASAAAARDAVLVRLNNVDGIFSGQVGVEIRISSVDLYDGTTDPFTATTVPGNLLTEVGRVRNGSATLKADGLTHLFTGRDLDGNTVGIAYINALCSRSFGVGLTESRGRGTVLESLITAHEIGHNFGAVHDGSGECPSPATPPDQFIMAPQSSLANNTFSQCSVGTMSRSIAAAACVGAIPPPDVSVAFEQPPTVLTQQQPFMLAVVMSNVGGQQTPSATLTVTVPTDITVESAVAAGGTCVLGAGSVQCSLGAVDAGTSRTVALTLRALGSGTFAVTALGTATNDGNAGNNSATASLAVDAAVPVVTPPAAPTGAAQGGGGGGGGGAMEFLTLGLLALLVAVRRQLRGQR